MGRNRKYESEHDNGDVDMRGGWLYPGELFKPFSFIDELSDEKLDGLMRDCERAMELYVFNQNFFNEKYLLISDFYNRRREAGYAVDVSDAPLYE